MAGRDARENGGPRRPSNTIHLESLESGEEDEHGYVHPARLGRRRGAAAERTLPHPQPHQAAAIQESRQVFLHCYTSVVSCSK
ncbi:hypothetical protein MTO96_045181 [Rhipicephalus appendiculatus]